MQVFEEVLEAQFIERPNRFVVKAQLGEQVVEAYLANPGRLSELLFAGVTLLMERSKGQGKMDYRVVALALGDSTINLHTHESNAMAAWLINQGHIPSLAGWRVKKREQKVGHSRFDLLLEKDGVERLGEVKSCTLFTESFALFPDAPSERATKHLKELAELAPPSGPKPLVLFLVQKQGLKAFLPDWHTDLTFAQTLLEVKDRLEILPIAVELKPDLSLSPQTELLPIPWDLLEQQAKDEGDYLYIMQLPERQEISVGSLGPKVFEAGFYVYVGSARKNLSQRLARHQRLKKKAHWHIDYLRAAATHHMALPVRSQDAQECDLAQALSQRADWEMPGFGCCDCHCASHLFGFSADPTAHRAFWDLLFHYRVDRFW
ncbi:MAG: DNA/RNA nuclease SfsA [bacterium]|nr:DNA/RNA nuclease SfsA [bacterium]